MALEFCRWFVWGGWEVSSALHGNMFSVLWAHGLQAVMTHRIQTLCSVVRLAYLLGDLRTSVWACDVACIPSCARFTGDVCIWDAFAWEPGVLTGRAHAFELCGSLLQSLISPKYPMVLHSKLWGLLQLSRERGSRTQTCRYHNTSVIAPVTTTALG